MAWTRIDDKFLNNAKIQEAGAYPTLLYLAGLIYCNTNLTDGFIPKSALSLLYGMSFQDHRKRSVKKLLELGLWHVVDAKSMGESTGVSTGVSMGLPVGGKKKKSMGYQVNDFLDFNKSRKEIEHIASQRGKAGKKGMETRWGKPDKNNKQDNKRYNNCYEENEGVDNKRYNKTITLTLNPNLTNLTPNVVKLVEGDDDLKKLVDFGVIFEELTGREPVMETAILEKAKSLITENVTHEEYRTAILEMLEKGYAVASIASPVKWVFINRIKPEPKPRNNGFDLSGYEVNRSSEIVITE